VFWMTVHSPVEHPSINAAELDYIGAGGGLTRIEDRAAKVSAFPAIGYDHPDQSHFTSRHYYEIGELNVGFRTGWMGRYLDIVGDEENPLQGLSMDGSLSPMIATAQKPVAAIDSVDGYDLWAAVSDPARETETHRKALAQFREELGKRHPKMAVETGLMALDGSVEMLG